MAKQTGKRDYPVLDITRLSLLVRWSTVVFPVEQWKLLQMLPELGYVPTEAGSQRAGYGTRLEVTGIVGQKGVVTLILDAQKPGLQIESNDPELAIEELNRIENVLFEQLGFGSEKAAKYYEFDCQVLIWSERSPLDLVRKSMEGLSIIDHVSKAVRMPVAAYSLKVAARDERPSSETWYEVLIEPSSRSPDSAYFAYLVCRMPARKDVLNVANKVSDIFRSIVLGIERT